MLYPMAKVRIPAIVITAIAPQWLMFEDVWRAAPAGPVSTYETVRQASGLRRR